MYSLFDQRRKTAEAQAEDAQELEELRALEQQIEDKRCKYIAGAEIGAGVRI